MMKENEVLKYLQNGKFNSEILNQYDMEGQKYFLSYLLRKGYKFNIKNGQIEFKEITSENKIRDMIDKYNNESRIENLNIIKQSLRAIRIMGVEEYSQSLEKKLRSLKRTNKELQER